MPLRWQQLTPDLESKMTDTATYMAFFTCFTLKSLGTAIAIDGPVIRCYLLGDYSTQPTLETLATRQMLNLSPLPVSNASQPQLSPNHHPLLESCTHHTTIYTNLG